MLGRLEKIFLMFKVVENLDEKIGLSENRCCKSLG